MKNQKTFRMQMKNRNWLLISLCYLRLPTSNPVRRW